MLDFPISASEASRQPPWQRPQRRRKQGSRSSPMMNNLQPKSNLLKKRCQRAGPRHRALMLLPSRMGTWWPTTCKGVMYAGAATGGLPPGGWLAPARGIVCASRSARASGW